MPDLTTPNLGLTKPQIGSSDGSWGGKINGDFDLLDAAWMRLLRVPQGEIIVELPPAAARTGGKYLLGPDPSTGAITLLPIDNVYRGPTGPANSTYPSIGAMQGAPITNGSYILANGIGSPLIYSYVAGDFSATPIALLGSYVVKLNAVPLTAGALVRQGGAWDARFFGARGDGVTDDRPALQAGLDFMGMIGGGLFELPVGQFRVTGINNNNGLQFTTCLTISSNTTFRGQGKTASVIMFDSNDQAVGPGGALRIITKKPGDISGVTIEDIGVNGNLPGNPQLTDNGQGGGITFGLFEDGAISNIRVTRCAVASCYGQGIQIAGRPDQLAYNLDISENDVYNCSFIGIQISQYQDLHVYNNKVSGCHDNGIDLYGFNNNFSAPAVTSNRGLIHSNRIVNCGGAGVFAETLRDTDIYDNFSEGCVQAVHANLIGGAITGVRIFNNTGRNCTSGYAVTGPMDIMFFNNRATGFTQSGLQCGTPGGEASYFKYSHFWFEPEAEGVPFVLIPQGVTGHNFVDPGIQNFVTQADTNNPTPPALWRVNYSSATIGSPAPVFSSATESTATARMRSPVIEGQPLFSDGFPVFANNAAALSAIGANKIYAQTTSTGSQLYVSTSS